MTADDDNQTATRASSRKRSFDPLLLLIGLQLLILGLALGWLLHDRYGDDKAESGPMQRMITIESAADDDALARMVAGAMQAAPVMEGELAVVFLSASDGVHPALVAFGRGEDVETATTAALAELRRVWGNAPPPLYITLDVVEQIHTLLDVDLTAPLPFDRSLAGFALDWDAGLVFLPQETLANTLINGDGVLQIGNVAQYAAQRMVRAARLDITLKQPATLETFTTRTVFTDGKTVISLYRGHRLYDAVTPDGLLAAAARGGDYLVHAVDDDGRFVYAYFPETNLVSTGYNIVRHAGTLYAMVELYGITGDPELGAAIDRALGYMIRATQPCPGLTTGVETRCLVENDEVKLGSNALAIVALVEYMTVTGDETYLPETLELAAWIKEAQQPDGSMVHKVVISTGEITAFESQYYPGEAILGMTRLYRYTGDAQWLDVAEAAAQYLILVRDADVPVERLNHDHWLLYALNDLYRQRPEQIYLDHALRITDAILDLQRQANPLYPDWLGSYYNPPRSTPTATRTEGLCAAYRLFRDYDLDDEADRIMPALELGVRFQLQTQFDIPSAQYVRDPQRVQGGFHGSLTDFMIRNDYVQHNISALLCVAAQMEE